MKYILVFLEITLFLGCTNVNNKLSTPKQEQQKQSLHVEKEKNALSELDGNSWIPINQKKVEKVVK